MIFGDEFPDEDDLFGEEFVPEPPADDPTAHPPADEPALSALPHDDGASLLELLQPLMELVVAEELIVAEGAVEANGEQIVSDASLAVVAAPCGDGASDVVAQIQFKYGIEHIKKYATPGKHMAVTRKCANDVFQNFKALLKAPIAITPELLAELSNGDDTANSAYIKLMAMGDGLRLDGEFDLGIDGGLDLESDAPAPSDFVSTLVFFKADLRNPQQIEGQSTSHITDWGKHAFVVTCLRPVFVDSENEDVFLWTEPADLHDSVKVLTPTNDFVSNVTHWTADSEKYYFSPI